MSSEIQLFKDGRISRNSLWSEGNPGISSSKSKHVHTFIHKISGVLKKCANFPVYVNRSFKLKIENDHVYILLSIGKIRILTIPFLNIILAMVFPGGWSRMKLDFGYLPKSDSRESVLSLEKIYFETKFTKSWFFLY